MKIVPQPKKIEINDGFVKEKTLKLGSVIEDSRLKNALGSFNMSDDGTVLYINIGQNECGEGYNLKIDSEEITIDAEGAPGAFYAIQTLKQIFAGDEVQCCYIEDKPDFKHRGFYQDITRGRVHTAETLKKLIDDMAYYKLNSLQLYVEHTYEFKEYADSVERTGYITATEIRELDEYCKQNFIDFIPSLSTFGHLYELLEKDRYKHLREVDEIEKTFFWNDRMEHHTIDPTLDESFELIKSLIDQYMENFSSEYFNICCDETFDLKKGRHKDEDTGKLYIDFVLKLIEYIKSKGKKVMMWADILLNHPEQIKNLPEDVELLNWWYWDNPNENTFKTIHDSKRVQIVCPGTGSWSRFCEDYDMDLINIIKMVDLGYKYGAEGVLNTNWGDCGNTCSMELAMFGFVLGAAKSWNVSTVVDEEYISAVDELLYKKEGASEYIKRLSDLCSKVVFWNLLKHYANITNEKIVYDEEIFLPENEVIESVDKCFELIKEMRSGEWEFDNYRQEIIVAAEAVAVTAELLGKHAGYSFVRRTDTEKWLADYREKWLSNSKESELHEIEKFFRFMDRR